MGVNTINDTSDIGVNTINSVNDMGVNTIKPVYIDLAGPGCR